MTTTTLADLRDWRLGWSDDREPGLRRRRAGRGFTYLKNGAVVRDAPTLARVRSLAIPPAWTNVWICASAEGHLQATGRDARGRKQYRYHPRYREHCETAKFEHLAVFGRALPAVRRHVAADLTLPGLPSEKVIATVVQLLESTLIRVGNEEYSQANASFGLTTLRRRHARVARGTVRLRFHGKSGIEHDVSVTDPRLRRIIRRCQDLPGQFLFQYLDGEVARPISSNDVNDYLRTATNMDITAKEFRTWIATLLAACALASLPAPECDREARSMVTQTMSIVSRHLGNTPAICRRSYIHPAVTDSFRSGELAVAWTTPARRVAGLAIEERRLLALLARATSSLDRATTAKAAA